VPNRRAAPQLAPASTFPRTAVALAFDLVNRVASHAKHPKNLCDLSPRFPDTPRRAAITPNQRRLALRRYLRQRRREVRHMLHTTASGNICATIPRSSVLRRHRGGAACRARSAILTTRQTLFGEFSEKKWGARKSTTSWTKPRRQELGR
jgi:hypothetical protein